MCMPAFYMDRNLVLTACMKGHKARSALGTRWTSVTKSTRVTDTAVLVKVWDGVTHSEDGRGMPSLGAGDETKSVVHRASIALYSLFGWVFFSGSCCNFHF